MPRGDVKGMPADLRPLLRAARAAGWTVTRRRREQLVWCAPGGAPVLTSNRHTNRREARARLRHHGLDV